VATKDPYFAENGCDVIKNVEKKRDISCSKKKIKKKEDSFSNSRVISWTGRGVGFLVGGSVGGSGRSPGA
jgi:hypothetical protein